MVCTWACSNIFFRQFTHQTWSMTIDGLPIALGYPNFLHDFRITVYRSGPVHHLCEVANFRSAHQGFNIGYIDFATGSFKGRGRYTGRGSKKEVKWNLFSIFNHVFYALHSTDICDLMRIGDGGNSAVNNRKAGKFRRNEHGRFHMNMRINKPWEEVG